MSRMSAVAAALVGSLLSAAGALADRAPEVPDAVVDLRTREGLMLVAGEWSYRDAEIEATAHRRPGPDLKASGPPNRTHDLTVHGPQIGKDAARWETVEPTTLEARRSGGRLSFGWYRARLTLPEKIGDIEVLGATVCFEIVVDDYAEVWVDGRLPLVLGQTGGSAIRGWNAPNRVLVTDDARPGATIEITVFAANGPLSDPPANFVWVRSATLDFYRADRELVGRTVPWRIERHDPSLDRLISPDAVLQKLADGFRFVEGPVWVADGYLLFSDPNANVIYRWQAHDGVSIFRTKSGYAGTDIGRYGQPGSNGLALDGQGRLTIAEHGRRRVTRLEHNGTITVLADRFAGRRLNSPNDLVYRSDGALFFSDPPFGLPGFHDDPRRELDFSGVYCLRDGKLSLVSRELEGPNGVAFSPDEKYLYVSNWDPARKVIMRYETAADCSVGGRREFFDMGQAPGEEALDGLKVDQRGNVWASGPGGVWVVSPEGRHLGTLVGPELPANFAWGGADGRTLYLTARTGLYRVELQVAGAKRPAAVKDR